MCKIVLKKKNHLNMYKYELLVCKIKNILDEINNRLGIGKNILMDSK